MSKRQSINKRGIDLAAQYLTNNGAEVIEREWKCDTGIADLIIKEADDIAFVQVKTRGAAATGFPEDAISKTTRAKLENLALTYLVSHDIPSARIRFDTIAIQLIEDSRAFLRHHRDCIASGA
jgi:putative endonuclease